MIAHMHQANQESGKHCKVVMDLAGPKLRTGPIHRGHHVVRWRVGKDTRGESSLPRVSRWWPGSRMPVPCPRLTLCSRCLKLCCARPAPGDIVHVKDSDKKKRELTVIEKTDHACICTCEQGAYVLSRAELSLVRDGAEIATVTSASCPLSRSLFAFIPAIY